MGRREGSRRGGGGERAARADHNVGGGGGCSRLHPALPSTGPELVGGHRSRTSRPTTESPEPVEGAGRPVISSRRATVAAHNPGAQNRSRAARRGVPPAGGARHAVHPFPPSPPLRRAAGCRAAARRAARRRRRAARRRPAHLPRRRPRRLRRSRQQRRLPGRLRQHAEPAGGAGRGALEERLPPPRLRDGRRRRLPGAADAPPRSRRPDDAQPRPGAPDLRLVELVAGAVGLVRRRRRHPRRLQREQRLRRAQRERQPGCTRWPAAAAPSRATGRSAWRRCTSRSAGSSWRRRRPPPATW